MYDVIVNLIGELPTEFTFIYSILTLAVSLVLISFLLQLFYLPIKIINKD